MEALKGSKRRGKEGIKGLEKEKEGFKVHKPLKNPQVL